MHGTYRIVCLTLLILSLYPLPALAAPPATQPAKVEMTYEALGEAEERAVDALFARQRDDGSWGKVEKSRFATTVKACLGLVGSRCASPMQPTMVKAFRWLAGQETTCPHCRALRCLVWARAGTRTDPGKYRKVLLKESAALYRAIPRSEGQTWPAGCAATPDTLDVAFWMTRGIWTAAEEGIEVPRAAWATMLEHWRAAQNADGGWGPAKGRPSDVTTTAMGIWATQTCYQQMHLTQYTRVGIRPVPQPAGAGLAWLEAHFRQQGAAALAGPGLPERLFLLQHATRATGMWHAGRLNLQQAGAAALLRAQGKDGAWKGPSPVASTAWALSLLAEARSPLFLARLRYNGDWNNRPHAVAHLTRWTDRQMCSPGLRWRIQDVRAPVGDWYDLPVLLITGSQRPAFTPAQEARLRTYVLRGGTIFSCVEGAKDGAGFDQGMRALYQRLLPRHQLVLADRKHPIYTRHVHFRLPPVAKLHILSNGVRPLVVHTETDLSLPWQLRRTATQNWAFQTSVNVVRYARDSLWRHELTPWPAVPGKAAKRQVVLARLKHAANCDPEPLAYERFSRQLGTETGVCVKTVPVAIKDLGRKTARLATLTGTGPLKLTDAEIDRLRQYVNGGGTLVIDAAGGDADFAKTARQVVGKMFGAMRLRQLAPDAPLYRLKGREILRVYYRRQTAPRLGGQRTPNLRAVLLGKRPAVIFSREDLTAGLVGYSAWTVDGYRPDSAYAVMRNIVLHTTAAPPAAKRPPSP